MIAMNKAFVAVFAMIGLFALGCAVFAGAKWHFYTSGLCTMMVLVGIADIRKCKKQQQKR